MSNPTLKEGKTGLVLTGGGARGAYQAGVICAFSEMMKSWNVERPYPILTGTSAGAVNASFLATQANDIYDASERLAKFWSSLEADQIFYTDALSLGRIVWRWIRSLSFGGIITPQKTRAILNNQPLRNLLSSHIDFRKALECIESGALDAVAITATDYESSHSISFVQGHPEIQPWTRSRRRGIRSMLSVDHIMASSAIPVLFPPTKIDHRYYGDGSLRSSAPLSPAIHCGATRLIIINVKKDRPPPFSVPIDGQEPSLGKILGVVLNSIMLDAVDPDLERLARINQTLGNVVHNNESQLTLNPIYFLQVRPSQDIGKIAAEEFHQLPSTLKYLLRGFGGELNSGDLISYLSFSPSFCSKIVALGYEDGRRYRSQLEALLSNEQPTQLAL
jgi:NTE family protein